VRCLLGLSDLPSKAVEPVPVGVRSPSKATDLCTGVAASIRALSSAVWNLWIPSSTVAWCVEFTVEGFQLVVQVFCFGVFAVC
jgi:hypothetical protein